MRSLSPLSIVFLIVPLLVNISVACSNSSGGAGGQGREKYSGQTDEQLQDETQAPVNALLVLPKNPAPGTAFRIFATGGRAIRNFRIIVKGSAGSLTSQKSIDGSELPFWRIDDFPGVAEGKYTATLISGSKEVSRLDFIVSKENIKEQAAADWNPQKGWDSKNETLYSAWINALFHGCDENSSWTSLSEVIRNPKQNFLYDYFSLGEDKQGAGSLLIMQPDCADNPFFLRAYFSWKLGLPFGYHLSDRGWVGRSPRTSQWITNKAFSQKGDRSVAFNNFLRGVMNGVHSGTARTALDDESSDYYPVPLTRESLRPGTVFADPYGHTLILVSWVPQTKDRPGLLLSVDAQPDGTVGIKRFWKGNFLFNTSGVIGEPGFKAFRPVTIKSGSYIQFRNTELTAAAGFVPYSVEQRKMGSEPFYHAMERLINPRPLDPEAELIDLIEALHEQLLVRVTSVANGEAYMKSHPGSIIPMPSSANGIFLAGGQWENFSTPNRDLRLLIAMDAVLDFPDRVVNSPGDFSLSGNTNPRDTRDKLMSIIEKKAASLSITYTKSDGTPQKLSVADLLKRKDAFEMTYNPNDGIEIRWGAPENSEERSTCRRSAPRTQQESMNKIRPWFHKRLHPPT